MLSKVAKVRGWWVPERPRPDPRVPYDVACACGQVAHGFRLARHQALICPGCGRGVFILPISPLVSGKSVLPSAATPSASLVQGGRWWRLPLLAAGLTLAIVIAAFALFLRHPSAGTSPRLAPNLIGKRLQAGQAALGEGKFRQALEELERAQAMREGNPQALSLADRRQLVQLHRQARLLVDLLHEPLGEILRQAAEIRDDQEWQSDFNEFYRGKSVVFDAEVRREGADYHLEYALFVNGRPARLDLANLQLLRQLPLHQPQRLLWGARLASVQLEAGGAWVIRFQPDSGVLLTEPGAAVAACSQPLEEIHEVVQRQRAWLADLP